MTSCLRNGLRSVAVALVCAGCAGSAATTLPATSAGTDVLAAHGYALPRDQLAKYIVESVSECGWTLKTGDAASGVFIAQKQPFFTRNASTLTVVIRPVGDRLRVDVTSTSEFAPTLGDRNVNKQNVWGFYEALDKRAGDPSS